MATRRLNTPISTMMLLLWSVPVEGQLLYPATDFGVSGAISHNILGGEDTAFEHTLLPDGNVLLAGGGYDINCNCYHIAFAKFDTICGARVPEFGNGGSIAHIFQQRSTLRDMAVLPDGRILACGQNAPDNSASLQVGAVYRFNADGSADLTMNGTGWRSDRFDAVSSGVHSKVIPLNNGRFYAVGTSGANSNGGAYGVGIMRFLENGSLDTDFNGDGKVWSNLGGQPYQPNVHDAILLPDSSVLIAGSAAPVFGQPRQLILIRFDMNGNLFPDFGTSGVVFTGEVINESNAQNRAIILPDAGNILIGFTSASVGIRFAALRLSLEGVRDASYGTNGLSVLTPGSTSDIAFGMYLNDDGSSFQFGTTSANQSYIVKRDPQGQPALDFGNSGLLLVPQMIADMGIRGGLPLPDDRMLIYGHVASQTMLYAKLTPDPLSDAAPSIQVMGEELLVTGRGEVQWSYAGLPIQGASTSTIEPQSEGVYSATRQRSERCILETQYNMLGNHLFSVSPNRISTNNTHLLRLHGSFYFDTATVVLRQGSTEFTAHRVSVNDVVDLAAVMTLTEAPFGAYDLIVSHEGYADTLFSAIEVIHPIADPGSALQLEVIGPRRTLANTEYIHTLRVHNPTGQAVVGATVHMMVDGQVDIALMNGVVNMAYTDSLRNNFMHQRDFLKISPIEQIGPDSLLFGWFVVPFVPPGTYRDLNFRIRAADVGYFDVHAELGDLLLTPAELAETGLNRTSCDFLPNFLDCNLDIAGMAPGVACLTSSLSYSCAVVNLIESAYQGSENLLPDIFNISADILGLLTCAGGNALQGWVENEGRQLLLNTTGYSIGLVGNLAQGNPPALGLPGGTYALPASCVDFFFNGGLKPGKKRTLVLFAIDPNEKLGPVGCGAGSYTHPNKQMDYTISFENAVEATAPAREVILVDTLDLNTLDPRTLRFTGFSFDTVNTTLTGDRHHFIADVDLRPTKETIVRVVGSVDDNTGIVTASFQSFDPTTQALTLDVDAGFLNPNLNGTEGLGHVTFVVDQRPDLPHLSTISNQAAIIFDANAAIITTPHVNRIDTEPPVSAALTSVGTSGDTLLLDWSAFDAHAGLRTVEMVIVRNATDTFTLVIPGNTEGPVKLLDAPGNQFRIHTIAIDSLGNRELPPAAGYDVEVWSIGTGIESLDHMNGPVIFPNPTSGAFTMYLPLASTGKLEIVVLDQQGRAVRTFQDQTGAATGLDTAQFNLPTELASGTYILLIRTGSNTQRSVLIKH